MAGAAAAATGPNRSRRPPLTSVAIGAAVMTGAIVTTGRAATPAPALARAMVGAPGVPGVFCGWPARRRRQASQAPRMPSASAPGKPSTASQVRTVCHPPCAWAVSAPIAAGIRPAGTAHAATSVIAPRGPPAARYLRSASQMASRMPATMASACHRSATGPRCTRACGGLGMDARGIPGHYRSSGARPRAGQDHRAEIRGVSVVGVTETPWISPGVLWGAADAVGQVGREGADVGDGLLCVLRRGEAADERGADDDAVGEAGDLLRLGGVGHAEAHRDRQAGVLAGSFHQRGGA